MPRPTMPPRKRMGRTGSPTPSHSRRCQTALRSEIRAARSGREWHAIGSGLQTTERVTGLNDAPFVAAQVP